MVRRRRDERLLAIASVGLGLGQIALIRALDATLPHPTAVRVEGTVFAAYLILVLWLLWRLQIGQRAFAMPCPSCDKRLVGLSVRMVLATGRCDRCGGQVLEPD